MKIKNMDIFLYPVHKGVFLTPRLAMCPTGDRMYYHEAAHACFCSLSLQHTANSPLCSESIFIAPLLFTELQNTTNTSNRINVQLIMDNSGIFYMGHKSTD